MAKKKDKEKGKSRADAVRSAVDQAFQATAGGAVAVSRERATDIADELSGVVARLRDTLDDNRPASGDQLRGLRDEVAALAARVDRLEAASAAAAAPKPAPRARAATTQAAAKRAQAAARKPASGGAAGTRTAPSGRSTGATGASKAPSAGAAADGDVKRASTAARTTRARAAAGTTKRTGS